MLTRFVAEGGAANGGAAEGGAANGGVAEGGTANGGSGLGLRTGVVTLGSRHSDIVSLVRGRSDVVGPSSHAARAADAADAADSANAAAANAAAANAAADGADTNADAANATAANADATAADATAADVRLRELLSRSSRVCVEVGAGAGEWLVAQAAAHRGAAWVAIEPQLDRVHQLSCKVQLRRLNNVHICAAEAATALKLLPAAAVDAVHLRFPYPPPLELRDLTADTPPGGGFLAASLITDLLRALKPGGELHLVTNEPACCVLLLALVQAHPASAQLRSEHGEAGFARSLEAPGPHGSFFDAVLAERGHRKDHSKVRHERFSLTYTYHPLPTRVH